MIWKDFFNTATDKLAGYLESDIQYSNISKNRIRQIARREIEIFVQHIKKWTPTNIILNENKIIPGKDQEKANRFIKKRQKSIPLAYILGYQEFRGLNFKVNKNTLIPRPETEELVEYALNFISKPTNTKDGPLILIDVGTGSGCVITSIVGHLPKRLKDYRAFAVDASEKALRLAGFNAKHNLGKKNKIKFLKGSLLDFIRKEKIPEKAELLITANLPYLSEKEYASLSGEVKNNEPKEALVGGPNGHELICKLLDQAVKLSFNCTIFLEISPAVYLAIEIYCATLAKPLKIRKFNDMSGITRILCVNFKF